MKKLIILLGLIIAPLSAMASGGEVELPQQDWEFQNVTAKWDKDTLRRGYTVATQICMGCHGFKYISHRTLMDKGGFSEAEAMSMAEEMGKKLDDKFASPLSEEDSMAMYAKVLPDLSLINKARPGGPDYTYNLITGYSGDPEEIHHNMPDGVPDGAYYNTYFPGHAIAMPPPLGFSDMVEYHDGTEASIEQMAKDVTYFMQWTAEPELTTRQRLGVYVLIYLAIFTLLTWMLKRKVWSDLH